MTDEVWYYLRGEEYSAQIDHFARCIAQRKTDGENTFGSALQTDRVVAMILADGASTTAMPQVASMGARRGWRARLFG